MNKTERLAVGALVVALIAWTYLSRSLMPEPEPMPTVDQEVVDRAQDPVLDGDAPPAEAELPVTEEADDPVDDLPPAEIITLTNAVFAVDFVSHGGGISAVRLFDFDASVDERGVPLALDFAEAPALRFGGLPGVRGTAVFTLEPLADGSGIRMSTASRYFRLVRTITLADGYELLVRDQFENLTEDVLALAGTRLYSGFMELQEAGPGMRGMSYLGVDFLPADGGRVAHTSKRVRNFFGVPGGCGTPDMRNVPMVISESLEDPAIWAASKNKFFVQILEPALGIDAVTVMAERRAGDAFVVENIAAQLHLPSWELAAGESVETEMRFYVGPKKFSILRRAGNQWSDVMEFGRFFKWMCQILLPLLNAIESVVPGGYGVAVILLTVIVKLLFWPVTHKGTESMKRMQALQPELKKLREKYKKDPKKLQEKQMLLYREHKVNPLAGCIPMVIQIPVFIGLFTVLRSAVELRYARFLWIADLSEPEGLLAGVIPFPASGLNILPLLMTATMVLQQRLTPTAGDPQQQKMMAFMPVMMLFIFYTMPSGLVLYWSVSQGLSILQLYLQRRRSGGSVAVAS